MNAERRRSQRDYTLAFKLAVVDQVEKGEMSYKEAQDRYGIQVRSTVLMWLRKHGRQDWSAGNHSIRRFTDMTQPPLPQTPEQRIKELEQQLAQARPTPEQVDTATFRAIVGDAKYTPGGQLKGTIFDGVDGGFLEIKGGSSELNSTYQLRLQTYKAIIDNRAVYHSNNATG